MRQLKKVIHIISGDLWAGAEVQIYNTVLALKRNDISILCILFNKGILEENLTNAGISVKIFDENSNSTTSIIFQCRKIVKDFSPDIIHVHRNKEHFVGLIGAKLSAKKTSIVRTVHGKSGVPSHLPYLQHLRSTIVVVLDTILIRFFCNAIIAVSKDMYTHLKQCKPKGVLKTIYNAINTDTLEIETYLSQKDSLRKKYSCDNSVFWVGTAARLAEPKNLFMLIRSCAYIEKLHPGLFRFSIFGEGPYRALLQNFINEQQVSHIITLHGFEREITSLIASFDTFVLCSTHEGLPMALLEAMALSKPVICTAVGGMAEIIKHNQNGILVPSNEHIALSNQIIRLKNDPTLCTTLGANAHNFIQNNFSIANIVSEVKDFYTSVLKG